MLKCDFSRRALPRQMTTVTYGQWEGGPVRSLVRCKEINMSAQKCLWIRTRTASSFTIVHCEMEWRMSTLPGPEVLKGQKQSAQQASWSFWCDISSLGTSGIRECILLFCLDRVALAAIYLEKNKNMCFAAPFFHGSSKLIVDSFSLYILEVMIPNSF